MPVRNEASFIDQTLNSVLDQDYPPERFEVIVADGRSTDGCRERVADVMVSDPFRRVRLVDNERAIFSTGFNVGLRQARGEVVVMLGGHTELGRHYLRRCVDWLLLRPDVDCVGGFVETVPQTPASKIVATAMMSPFGVGGVAFRTRPNSLLEVDTVAFGAYRREALTRCGYLDEELVRDQDDEFNYRLRELGGRILLVPDLHTRYFSRGSLSKLWRQYLEYGFWKVRVMQKHPRQMRPRHFIPAAFVGSLILLAAAAPFSHLALWLLCLDASLYVLANLTASALAWTRDSGAGLFLPLAFVILHVSYGLGFLSGLVRFASRWERTRSGSGQVTAKATEKAREDGSRGGRE
jgi:cellulose synthase/poly-beta-1,6-N-acetylglucosamine synthase-like glycosyltransferase